MRITKFSVRNYRSCKTTTLEPNNDLTALIGVNGSGKSNLLNALLLLKRTRIRPRHHIEEEERYVNRSYIQADIDLDGNAISLKGEVYYYTTERNTDDVVGTNLKWNLESITGKKAWINLPIEMIMYGVDLPFVVSRAGRRLSYNEMSRNNWLMHRKMNTLLPEKVFPVVEQIASSIADINYYSASQFSDPTRCPVSFKLENECRPPARRGDLIDHTQFMFDLYKSWKTNKEIFQRYLSIVGKGGIGLVDVINFNEIQLPSSIVEVRAGGKTTQKQKTQLIVVPIFKIDNQNLSPNQLSEGTFKTLALLFYVLTDQSQILLVEEPEVCIHHGLLNSIITLIKEESKSKQIIISTHSDYVLDQLTPDNIVLVERKNDKGTKAKKITKAMSKNDFRALKDYLDNTGNLGEYWREGGLDDE